MSFAAEGWAWEQDCPSSASKLVLVCLAWYANKEGDSAYPSIPTIRRRTGLADATVRKALVDLRAHGLIEPRIRERDNPEKRHLTTEYRLKIGEPPLLNLHPSQIKEGSKSDTPPLSDLGGGDTKSDTPPPLDLGGNLSIEPRKELKTESESISHRKTRKPKASSADHPRFAEFYRLYPRKDTGPKPVSEKFNLAIAHGADPEDIIAGLRRYPFSADRQFQPMATTWLHQERWKAAGRAEASNVIQHPASRPTSESPFSWGHA